MNLLLPGLLIGAGGFIAGASLGNRKQDILDTLDPLKDAVKEAGDMYIDYQNTYDAMSVIIIAYTDGANVNIDEYYRLKDELKLKEAALDDQILVIAQIIEEVGYGV